LILDHIVWVAGSRQKMGTHLQGTPSQVTNGNSEWVTSHANFRKFGARAPCAPGFLQI